MRPSLIILAFVASALPAAAACPAVPDGPESRYVENTTARALCLARDLAAATENAAANARIEVELGNIESELQRQRALVAQQLATGWPGL